MLQILLADDHELMRRGVRNLLESHEGWRICAEAANGRQAVALAGALQPEVAVLDLSMPELNGLEAARQIHRVSGRTAVLLFSAHHSEATLDDAVAVGARGYVLKSEAASRLAEAVAALAEGTTFFPATGSGQVQAGTVARAAAATRSGRLTPREREVAQLLAEGKTNWCVATILGISARTVETHRDKIMRKLGLESVVELVHYAVRNRLVDP
jgi:DNA-binding NarL/FixJ family response regulator